MAGAPTKLVLNDYACEFDIEDHTLLLKVKSPEIGARRNGMEAAPTVARRSRVSIFALADGIADGVIRR